MTSSIISIFFKGGLFFCKYKICSLNSDLLLLLVLAVLLFDPIPLKSKLLLVSNTVSSQLLRKTRFRLGLTESKGKGCCFSCGWSAASRWAGRGGRDEFHCEKRADESIFAVLELKRAVFGYGLPDLARAGSEPSSNRGRNEDEGWKMICAPKVGHKQKVNEKE